MELTRSFIPLLQNFASVFTAPTYITFEAVVADGILSHRHRYINEVDTDHRIGSVLDQMSGSAWSSSFEAHI
jgi:hypothetical protein